jgi:hypothetical protein
LRFLPQWGCFFCSTTLINTNARGQTCPDASWPPGSTCDGTAWNGPSAGGPIKIPGTSCYVDYTYCWRECFDYTNSGTTTYFQYILESITPVPGSPCSTTPPDQMILGLLNQLEANGAWFPDFPPCSSGTYTSIDQFSMDCWEEVPPLDGNLTYVNCGSYGDYCETLCTYCLNPDGSVSSSCATIAHYDDGGCAPLPVPDVWVPGTCYDIAPCP